MADPASLNLRKYDELSGKTFALGVGAMKCGTSWVNAYLASLKNVTTSPLKEVHFFDSKFPGIKEDPTNDRAFQRLKAHVERHNDPVKNIQTRPHFQASVDRISMIYDDDAYFGHFARICTPKTDILCELTPAYAIIGKKGFRYVRKFFRTQDMNLNIFFLMRDPVDRLWSHFRFLAERDPNLDLLQNWKLLLDEPRIMERCDYRGTIEALDKIFRPDSVGYFFYESLFQEDALRSLCRFVGADYAPPKSEEVRNETSVKISMTDEMRAAFSDALKDQYDFCEDRFGSELPPQWRR